MIEPMEVFHFSKARNTDSGGFVFDWEVPESLPYLNGHFPGNPVLPGVAIVDASLVMIGLLDAPVFMNKLCSAKFTDLIHPHDVMAIEFIRAENKNWKVTWKKVFPKLAPKTVAELVLDVS